MTTLRVRASGEHHDEPVRGLPGALPEGERVLWQAEPDWRVLAREAFHIRRLALYFGLLVGWRLVSGIADGASAAALLRGLVGPLLLSALGLGLVAALAWMSARTTVYTLTNRRVAMRIGIVLTVTFNLPLSRIEGASRHALARGHGDIALQLEPGTRIGWLHLWPHVRPWRLRRTEPMLRALPQVDAVAAQLMAAWQAVQAVQAKEAVEAAQAVQASPQTPAAQAAHPVASQGLPGVASPAANDAAGGLRPAAA